MKTNGLAKCLFFVGGDHCEFVHLLSQVPKDLKKNLRKTSYYRCLILPDLMVEIRFSILSWRFLGRSPHLLPLTLVGHDGNGSKLEQLPRWFWLRHESNGNRTADHTARFYIQHRVTFGFCSFDSRPESNCSHEHSPLRRFDSHLKWQKQRSLAKWS